MKHPRKIEAFGGDHDIEVTLEDGTKLVVLVRRDQIEVWAPTGTLETEESIVKTSVYIKPAI